MIWRVTYLSILENGELDAKAVTGSFSDKVAGKGTVIPTLAEMVQKEKISPQLVPLFKDDAGMVPVYLVDGRLAAKGIDSSFVDLVYAALTGLFSAKSKIHRCPNCLALENGKIKI
ncbi:hypothetical protein LNQ52_16515 [Klebsiella pneumoniae subsp. pneumoniae]|nr:hypothetical protein [Klebsiella pneumoniae subsp. pneumoniae]